MRERDLRDRDLREGASRERGSRDNEHGARSEYEAMREGGSGQRVTYPQGYSESQGGTAAGYGPSTQGRDPYGGESRYETSRYPGSQGYGGGSEYGSARRTQRDDWEETRQYGQGGGMEYGQGRSASGWQSDHDPWAGESQRGEASHGGNYARQPAGDYGRQGSRGSSQFQAQPRDFGEGYGRSSGYGDEPRYGHARGTAGAEFDRADRTYRQRVDFSGGAGASYGTEWDRNTQHAGLGAGASPGTEGPYRGRGPRNYRRSQERILEDINERLTYDSQIDASGIEVRCADGKVVLEGEVDGRWMKHRAEDIAEACAGSLEIDNRLRVRRGEHREASGARSASSINDAAGGGQAAASTSAHGGTSSGRDESGRTAGAKTAPSGQAAPGSGSSAH